MSSNFNWEDLESNSISDLKREATLKGIKLPPKATKKQLIELLSKKVEPAVISSALLDPDSPAKEKSAVPKNNNINNNESERKPSRQQSPAAHSENNQQKQLQQPKPEEKREQSPVLPSKRKSSKSVSINPVNTVEDKREAGQSLVPNDPYVLPHNLIILNYLTGGFAALFAILGLLMPFLFIPSIALGILFYVVHNKLGEVVSQRANPLAGRVVAYLRENDGEAPKKEIQKKFRADRFMMNQISGMLRAGNKISIHKRKIQGEVWRLENTE